MEPVLSMQHVRMPMLKHGGEVNLSGNDGKSPLFVACLNGYEDIVQLLLDNGASSNVTTDGGVSPFDIACQKGHTVISDMLRKNVAENKF